MSDTDRNQGPKSPPADSSAVATSDSPRDTNLRIAHESLVTAKYALWALAHSTENDDAEKAVAGTAARRVEAQIDWLYSVRNDLVVVDPVALEEEEPFTATLNSVPGRPRVTVIWRDAETETARVRSDEAEPGHEQFTVKLADLSSFEPVN